MSESDPKPEAEEEEEAAVPAETESPENTPASASDDAEANDAAQEEEEQPPTAEERIAELKSALEDAHKGRLLALAEAENTGKRADKRISDNAKFATSNICKSLLQVADNLERALLAAPDKLRAENDVVKNLAVGVEMTAKELTTVLEGQGVSQFVSLDQPFDPNHHQAMQEVERTDVPSGTVVEVVQEGYMMADRLLRPAMVVVSKGGPKREVNSDGSSDASDDTENGINTEV